MTSSLGLQSAVSEYESLNMQNHYRIFPGKAAEDNSMTKDREFLPLKPRKATESIRSKQTRFPNVVDSNINCAQVPKIMELAKFDHLNFFGLEENQVPKPEAWSPGMFTVPNHSLFITPLKSPVHDSKTINEKVLEPKSASKVPQPAPWSPGMITASNPSLLITPQKSLTDNLESTTETVLEPQITSKVPQPVSWSPGMVAKPNPNLSITPEKTVGVEKTSNAHGEKESHKVKNMKKGMVKPKNKYSVRFDLPSSASGEETPDFLSESLSPITIKGSSVLTGEHCFDSPPWKTYSPQRAYNPNAYSDESSLDESSILSQSTPQNSPKQTLTLGVAGYIPSNIIDKFINGSIKPAAPFLDSNVSSEQSNNMASQKQHETDQASPSFGKIDFTSKLLDTEPQKLNPSKSSTLLPAKVKIRKNKNSIPQKAPDLPRSPPNLYGPPPTEFAVVREMKDNFISKEYSFPFEGRAASQEAEFEHVFARPEFNSTLKVRAELDCLYEQDVDVLGAVEATLASSDLKRLEINEKAASYTNCMSDQYSNLINLDTSVESLCDRVVRMRTSKVPSKRRGMHPEKKTGDSPRSPDLMEFFTSDLQKESPDLTLRGVTPVVSRLLTAPQDQAFDLYRHNRLWQGVNNFRAS